MAKKHIPPTIEDEEEEEEAGGSSEEYVTFKASYFYAALVLLAFGVGVLVGYVAGGRGKTAAAPTVIMPSTAVPQPTPEPVVYDVQTEGYPSLGPADAPITIVEFTDYQCPFCYRFYQQTYRPLLNAYPGKIRFVYRNFPLSFHQNAFAAAEAALCAGDQDKYVEYHDALFDNYQLLNNENGAVLEQAEYNKLAEGLGLDVAAFESCMTSRKYKTFIEDDMKDSATLPPEYVNGQYETAVGGTPTFFINGRRLGGAYPIQYFQQIIEEELAKQ